MRNLFSCLSIHNLTFQPLLYHWLVAGGEKLMWVNVCWVCWLCNSMFYTVHLVAGAPYIGTYSLTVWTLHSVHCIRSFILWWEEYPAKWGATTAAGITVHSFIIRYQSARYKVSGTGAAEHRYDTESLKFSATPINRLSNGQKEW